MLVMPVFGLNSLKLEGAEVGPGNGVAEPTWLPLRILSCSGPEGVGTLETRLHPL
jgi:hypothetical protein